MRATGAWWRTSVVPWAYETSRRLRYALALNWPTLAGALLGGILCALIGCGRGPAPCHPVSPANPAQSDGVSSPAKRCEAKR